MTGSRIYQRTQLAWPTIVPLVLVGGLLVPVFYNSGLIVPMWIIVAVTLVSLALFATLTVTVTSDGVEAAFGIGLVHTQLMFGDIESFAAVRNTWLHGWGIHYFPGGVVWNASGFSAVEFRRTNGRRVRIGTAEPEALVAALTQGSGKQPAAHTPVSTSVLAARQIIGIAVGALAIVFAAWMMWAGFRPPVVTVGDTAFTVSNGWYSNTVPYTAIRTMTLESELPRIGLKTNGFAARNTLRGSFRVDKWGSSRLYVNLDVPPYVVVQSGDSHVVVNFKDPEQTRRLYVELKSHAVRIPR